MAEPQVPSIAPVSQPQNGGAGTFDSIIQQVSGLANAELPPQYIKSTTLAEPKLPRVTQYQPLQEHNAPITGQVADVKRARRENSVAGLANMIGKFGQQIQQKKQDLLKEDLKSVMQSRTNIANAEAVLQQDPNNAMAKAVLAKNKQSLEAIMTDPKKQKQLQKALDISFTDPAKNKTPEVQAYQKAKEEVDKAGPFNSNNPEEHKVSMQALAPGGEGVGHNAPPQQASQTPHADAVTAKDLPGMQENPQYAVALKEKQDAQNRMNQYIIPRMITEAGRQAAEEMRGNTEKQRDYFKAEVEMQRDLAKAQAALTTQKAKDEAAMARTKMQTSAAMAQTRMKVDAMLKVSDSKNLSAEQREAVKKQAKDVTDKSIQDTITSINNLDKQRGDVLASGVGLKPEEQAERLKAVDAAIKNQNNYLKELQSTRQDKLGIKEPIPITPEKSLGVSDYFMIGAKALFQKFGARNAGTQSGSTGTSNTGKPETVGASLSDEDNSDLFGSDDDEDEN